ncbi:MAG: adenylyl-sulfate kinase [Parvibaculaceae bacterium]|nr:adenylyl-sulfate kinase [Parvibaculaceae bacterium]
MSLLGKVGNILGNSRRTAPSTSPDNDKQVVLAPDSEPGFEPKLVLITGGSKDTRLSMQAQLTTAHHGQLTSFAVLDDPIHVLSSYLRGERLPDVAVLLVNATEGVDDALSRVTHLLSLLDICEISVAVTHMAEVDHEEDQFTLIAEEVSALAQSFGLVVSACVPVSAVCPSDQPMPADVLSWYEGVCLVESLASLAPRGLFVAAPLRVHVETSEIVDEHRVLSGNLLSGVPRWGDEIILSPSNKRTRIHSVNYPAATAFTAESTASKISIVLVDDGFVEVGQVLSHTVQPPIETDVFRTRLMNFGPSEIVEGQALSVIILGGAHEVVVQKVEHVVDLAEGTQFGAHKVGTNQVAELVLRTRGIIGLDAHGAYEDAGYLSIQGEDGTVEAAGLISMAGYADQRSLITPRSSNITLVKQSVSADERAHRNSHRGGVLWFTGLSGAGKSTLAVGLEQELFKQGFHTALLDGDNVRHGLNANLGFSPEDRAENVRRVGEVAALFQQSGILVMASFISPYRSDRERARDAAADGFHEIYIKADVDTCIERDPKGLYQRALAGEILDFTGISAPYEVPEHADLVVDTGKLTVDQSIALLVDYVNTHFKV